ncbi:MAG: hypothetical protein R2818_02750 [Flavobacteriales bacterium]
MAFTRRTFIAIALRALLMLLVLCLVALAVAAWWVPKHGDAWLDRTLRARITEIIDDASVEGYRFAMEGLETDVRNGNLVITGVQLTFDPALLDSLRNGAHQYLFAASVERIELRGLSFWRLVWGKEFRVRTFELKGPTLSYLIGGEKVDMTDPFARLGTGDGRSITLLSADTLMVHRATTLVEDLGERLPRLNVRSFSLHATEVHAYMGRRRGGVRLAVGGAELDVDDLSTQLSDGAVLSISSAHFSLGERTGRVLDIRHASGSPQEQVDTTAVLRMELVVDSLLLTHFDVDRLISHQQLHTGHVGMYGLDMQVVLDKTLTPVKRSPRTLPPQSLLDLGFPIRVDTLGIVDARVVYRERDDGTERWGVLPFSKLNGRFLHISNREEAIEEHERITGTVEGMIFDTAQVTCTYSAELDGSQDFTIVATASQLPFVALNAITRPLMRLELQGGMLEHLELSMEGDERKAKGSMALRYTDLRIRVEPGTPRALHNSMFGNVLETMLTETYGGGMTADRERKYTIDRDPERALTGYLWHATREGLARNLTPEAWDRMRDMLRSDAEQRRSQRAARRAKKQERR